MISISLTSLTTVLCGAFLLADRSSAFSSPRSCRPFASSSLATCDGTTRQITGSNTRNVHSAFPLFTASKQSLSEEDIVAKDAAIRSLEKKMDDFSRKKEKVLAELEKTEKSLSSLQKVKSTYLEGIKLGIEQEKNFSESTVRSAVKAFSWRVIAGAVTFFTSLRFSGSVSVALSIVASDFFSKAATMFIGERLMNKSKAGRKTGADNASRSLAKALVWRLFAICNTLTMSLVIAKDLSMASKIAGSDALFKTGLMFFYERAWAKVDWGKEYFPDFVI